jgi:hypothetical protein
MDGLLGNLFGIEEEDPLLAMLPPEQRARLQQQARGQGMTNLGLALLQAGGPSRTPTGIGSRLGQAGMQAMQANQGVMDRGLERLMAARKFQQEEKTRELRQTAINALPEDLRPLAMIDPNSLGELYKFSKGIGLKGYDPVTPKMRDDLKSKGVDLDPNKNYQIEKTTGQISELGSTGALPRPTLNVNDLALVRRLGWNEDARSWTPEQGETWRQIQNAPSPTEATRLILDARRTQFETGGGAPIPRTESQLLPSLPSAAQPAPQMAAQPPIRPSSSTLTETVAPARTPTGSVPMAATGGGVFQQVTPKEQQKLLLERPQAIQNLGNMDFKFQSIESQIDNLLKNTKGLQAISGLSANLPNIRPDARNAQATLEYLRSRAATEALQAMRDASKTGGAVGQVTEKEWPRLESAFGSLAQSQTYEQLVENLKNLKDAMSSIKGNVRRSFEDTYGTDEQAGKVPLTPQSQKGFRVPGAKEAYEKYRR